MSDDRAEQPLLTVLRSLEQQGSAASHMHRLNALVDLANGSSGVRGVALVGSFAKQKGDRVSDLDLVVFVDSGHEHAVLSGILDILKSDQVLSSFSGSHGDHGAFCKLIYLDFSSVEVHVFGPDSPFRLKRPYLPVWDPKGHLPSCEVEGAPIRHEDFEPYEYGDEGLAWELLDCIKWLQRGHHNLAKNYLIKLGHKLTPYPEKDS